MRTYAPYHGCPKKKSTQYNCDMKLNNLSKFSLYQTTTMVQKSPNLQDKSEYPMYADPSLE